MLGLDLADTQTGIKALRQSIAAPIMHEIRTTGFAFDLELMCWLVDRGARVVEAPVVLDYEFTSTLKASSAWEALRDLAQVSAHRRERLRMAARIPAEISSGDFTTGEIAVVLP
jgi:hypothetical protein